MSGHCESCGASLKEWKHSLTRGLMVVFVKFCGAIKNKGVNAIHLQTEIELTKNEYNNFQKLHYFGLVAKDGRAGYWVLTTLGEQFLRHEVSIEKFVITFRDRLIRRSGPPVNIKDFYRGNNFDYWQQEYQFTINQARVCLI